ncbi:hypothetical protein [Leptolyngbya iicbica]|uniref:Uncharacterized protein n=2 Tax=Cyanophyceae TaxID=3028117 RepID=A0A4Q7EH07_9CYAN|nr:hypothetical protein [Leptolyngbya sp. LK]RZM82572.1 hypothetical protein DYY88_04860 [Leptolyngbya sp. LK]
MTPLDAATQRSLTAALYAYLNDYGGDSIDEVRAIAGAILAAKEQAGEWSLPGWEVEQWVDTLVADVDLSQPLPSIWQAADQQLAHQAQHWREQLAVKTRATVDAYLQQYSFTEGLSLHQLVATVLPLVTDATLPRDTARQLIETVSSQVDLSSVSDRVIDRKWVLLAEQVHQLWQQRDMANSVTDVMQAYVHKFQPAAVDIGESLIEQAVEAVSNSKLKLGLDTELTPDTRKLLIKQVMLQVKLRDMSSPPVKTALEIAQDLHNEVVRYRHDRGLDDPNYWPTTTTSAANDDSSALGGEISIGINVRPRPSDPESTGNISSTDS